MTTFVENHGAKLIFDLAEERKDGRPAQIHANNCAVRTEFFRANPFPDPAFKKQCGFRLRDPSARGYQYLRTAEARTVHAPHPDTKPWCGAHGPPAWTAISKAFIPCRGHGWAGFGAFRYFGRVVQHHQQGTKADLPVWQRPAAMAISLGFFSIALAGRTHQRADPNLWAASQPGSSYSIPESSSRDPSASSRTRPPAENWLRKASASWRASENGHGRVDGQNGATSRARPGRYSGFSK